MSIAVIDYDMGNLKSVSKALEHLGASVIVTRDVDQIRNASKVVLPGVGAFALCMENLKKYGLVDVILESLKSGKPFLGICLGFQLLFEESEEFGVHAGLGFFKGRVKKFPSNFHDQNLKVPHMGWNQISIKQDNPYLNNVNEGDAVYFVHSYYVEPSDKNIIATTTDYGFEFCSSVQQGQIFACQFHPEKSQQVGLLILENFVSL